MMPAEFFETWDPFLYKYHLYYRELSAAGRKRFVERVWSVNGNVDIIGKEGLEITDEIKILVVANLVQLTFGLRDYWLYGYDYIYLYPAAFYQKAIEEPVQGSTYQTKIIALSWHDVAFDHLHAHSGKNVSLAQFALGLVQTVKNGKSYDLNFGSYFDTWFEVMMEECKIKSEGPSATHLSENQEDQAYVFSRAMELFFEKPEVFQKELPASYAHLCLLMGQDPLNDKDDYRYDRSRLSVGTLPHPLPHRIPVNYRYKSWHWVYNIPFFGVSVGPIVLYSVSGHYMMSPMLMAGFTAITGIVIGIALYPYLRSIGLFKTIWMSLANGLLGWGPLLISFLLLFNQSYGYKSTAEISKHSIASFYLQTDFTNHTSEQKVTFVFSDEFLVDYPHLRTFESFEHEPVNPLTLFNGVSYEVRRGLIGIPIIYQKQLY